MDFLAPLFAAIGIAAASVPVVLHMLRRAPTQQRSFSLVRFLKVSRPKLTKRSTIQHWPLMLLRMLALILIGMAFARPFLRQFIPLEKRADIVQSVTLLIDQSASMRRDGIYEQVQKLIRQSADELGPQDLLSIVTFSDTSHTLVSRDKWATATTEERAGLVQSVMDGYEPDWMSTNTGTALRMAADELAQESVEFPGVQRRRLILITDFQRGSDLDELKSGQWPASVDVDLKTVSPEKKGNVGISFVKDRRTDRTRVRVTSAGDTVQQEYELRTFSSTGAAVGETIKMTLAPGQRQSVLLPEADREAGASVAGVELLGDQHPFDNVIDLPEIDNPVVKIAHLGSADINDPESMRYYLQRAFDGHEEREVRLVDLLPGDGVVLPIPDDVPLVIATAGIPISLMDSVATFLNRSGILLMAPPDVAAVQSLKKFLPEQFDVREAEVADYAMLSQIDFSHSLFSAFSDARFADFSSIRFWKYRNLMFSEENRADGAWTVVAAFDSGLPAIVDLKAGSGGRLILLATGWHPTDSQWALSTRFPPMLMRILTLASPIQKGQFMQTVGDIIRPAELVASEDWTITCPDGKSITAADIAETNRPAVDPAAGPTPQTLRLEQPGRYTVIGKGSEPSAVTLISSLAASESLTEMLPVGQLQVLGIGVKSTDATGGNQAQWLPGKEHNSQLSGSELEIRQKWWRWLLLCGLGCLILESLWASRIERRQQIT